MLVVSLGLFVANRSLALDPTRHLQQYNTQNWTRQNGLPVNGVTSITQSNDGYLWLGSTRGLVRFDGFEFSRYDFVGTPKVRNSIVNAIAAGKDGGVWVALENSGFGRFDGRNLSILSRDAWGGAQIDVHGFLTARDGALWLAAGAGGARLVPPTGEYTHLEYAGQPMTYNTFTAFEDRDGRMWLGTGDYGLFYWQDGTLKKLSDPALDGVIVFSLTQGPDGVLWVGTSVGLFAYDQALKRVPYDVGSHFEIVSSEVRALLTDRAGAVWIGANQGLYRMYNGSLKVIPTTSLAGAGVTALFEDREGSLWVGTRNGLSELTDVKFPIVPATEDGTPREVLGVGSSPRGGVWSAHTTGVTYYSEGRLKTYSRESGLPDSVFKRVFEATNGDVYIVEGARNLYVLADGKVVAKHAASNMVVGMAEDREGMIVSVGPNLFRANRDRLTPYRFAGKPPEAYWILNLLMGHDGALWMGTVNGLFRIKDGAWQRWGADEGLTDTHVYTLCEDPDGVIWMGTLNGIARLKEGRVRMISQENGLFDNNIYAIVPDDLGYLWIDSGRGIFRAMRNDLNAFADGKAKEIECFAYDGPESVQPADKTIQERVAAKSADGRIWLASSRGVFVIDPHRVPVNAVRPLVHVAELSVDGNVVADSHVRVPPGRGELHVQFTGLSFIAPSRMRFRYRLDGFDRDWTEVTNRRFASYTNLSPGTYTFRVIAANADGVWNASGDSFTVTLEPHFYETAWFFSLCLGSILAGLGGVYAVRVRQLKRKAKLLQENRLQLEREVRRRTAELAETNTAFTHEVEERKHAELELKQRTQMLEKEIDERKKMQREIERVHRELLEVSRHAGMAEVATGVLHNVGNVLNSVNVSATLVIERMQRSKIPNVAKLGQLLQEQSGNLADFLVHDRRGQQVPAYLQTLATHMETEQRATIEELEALRKNIGHINEIVAMQQNFAKVIGVSEKIPLTELVEDALRINAAALERHRLEVIREYEIQPTITVERHKVMQILVNLIRNAKYACDAARTFDKRLTLRVSGNDAHARIAVIDNGIGIAPENLTRIFSHGFTTRKDGHGFGLHSSALVAKELGGSLTVASGGIGHGAAFTLDLPLNTVASPPKTKRAGSSVNPGSN